MIVRGIFSLFFRRFLITWKEDSVKRYADTFLLFFPLSTLQKHKLLTAIMFLYFFVALKNAEGGLGKNKKYDVAFVYSSPPPRLKKNDRQRYFSLFFVAQGAHRE
eukprot:GEMP01137952.1.p1 GENE.GEMP01137952.1~~GEMP01137952.1.p1  ORF type:complete len:116 (+),score=6.91 GEMP01137952.1:35-349(+)